MRKYSFEKLDVWVLSRELTKQVYELSETFPKSEQFNLTSQIRRAAISITCNIAEGSGRRSGKDKARFTEIAFSSMLEVLNLLYVATDLRLVEIKKVEALRPKVEELGNKLNALRNSQLRMKSSESSNKQITK